MIPVPTMSALDLGSSIAPVVTFRQDLSASTGSGTSIAVTLGSPTLVGDLVVVNVRLDNASPGTVTATDTAGNTYAIATSQTGGISSGYQLYGIQATGGVSVVTVHWTTTTSGRANVAEFAGGFLAQGSVLNASAHNNGTAATTSSVSLTPTSVKRLIVAGNGISGTVTAHSAGSGYILTPNSVNGLMVEYKIAGTTSETPGFTWSGSASWWEQVGAYNPTY